MWRNELHPELVRRLDAVIALAAHQGIDLRVVSGYRSHSEQEALFAKGRTRPGRRVTNARGGQSWHNFGLAADLAPFINGAIYWEEKLFDWAKIGRWAAQAGLEWGGNWKKFKDRPHVQLRAGLELIDAQRLYRAHLNTLRGVWDQVTRKCLKDISHHEIETAIDDLKQLEPAAQIGKPAVNKHLAITPQTNAAKTESVSQSQIPDAPAQEQPVQEKHREIGETAARISALSKVMIFWREGLAVGATAMGFVEQNWYWFLIALALIVLAAWMYNESKKRADRRLEML